MTHIKNKTLTTLEIPNPQIALRIPVTVLGGSPVQLKRSVLVSLLPEDESGVDHPFGGAKVGGLQEHLESIVNVDREGAAAVLELLPPVQVLEGLLRRPEGLAPRLAHQRRRFEAVVAEGPPDFGYELRREVGEVASGG